MISNLYVKNCIAFGLALQLLVTGLLANEVWNITTPTANQLFTSASNIAGTGTTNVGATNYVCEVIQSGVTMNSNNGTSTGGFIPFDWSCTVANPTGGWTKNAAATFKITGSGGGYEICYYYD